MTPPADLAALRALVERVLLWPHAVTCPVALGHRCKCPRADVPAAQAELERVQTDLAELRAEMREGSTGPHATLLRREAEAHVARLEEALRSIKHLPRYEGQVALHELIDAALEGRDE